MANFSKPTDVNKVWGNANPVTPPSDVKINTGWVVEVPDYEDFQWLDNQHAQFIAHTNQHGLPSWDAVTEYQANVSYTKGSNGTIFRCLVTHTNKDPVSAPDASTYWIQAFDPFDSAYTKSEADDRYLNATSNLSDLQNAVTARSNLGLGTAATRAVGTAATNLMEVGAGGLLAPLTTPQTIDLNTLQVRSFIYVTNVSPNIPISDYGFVLTETADNVGYQNQTFKAASSRRYFNRTKVAGIWQGWVETFHTGNFDPATKVNKAGDTMTGTLTVPYLTVTAQGGTEGGEISLQRPSSGTSLSGNIVVDVSGDLLRIFENGGSARGIHFNFTQCNSGAQSYLWHSGLAPNLISGNGYLRLPNGLLIQWGKDLTYRTGEQIVNVTYPLAYSFVEFVTTVSLIAGVAADTNAVIASNPTTTGFAVKLYETKTTGGDYSGFSWISIGV